MKDRNIVLIGFMGTGKTTVGRIVADRLKWAFVDTDARIEKEQGAEVSQLFERHGECYFRDLETKTLRKVLESERQVIATGGGAVLAEANRHAMQEGGFVIALQADFSAIIQRVGGNTSRPLLKGNLEQQVSSLLEQRKHAYDFADMIIDTSNKPVSYIADRILNERKALLD